MAKKDLSPDDNIEESQKKATLVSAAAVVEDVINSI